MSASFRNGLQRHQSLCGGRKLKWGGSFLKTCKKQLDGTGSDCSKIDYSCHAQRLSTVQKAGIGFFGVFAGGIVIVIAIRAYLEAHVLRYLLDRH